MGDGDYELILTKTLNKDCIFENDTFLNDILNCCDGVYDDSGEYIDDPLNESDFVIHNIEINVKN